MKKLILSFALISLSFIPKSFACNYIRGTAELTGPDGNGYYTLTCPHSDELCATLNCNGTDITIYQGNNTIHGTVVNMVGYHDNGPESEAQCEYIELFIN